MTFILAIFVFVVLIGRIDAGLPWPAPKATDQR